MRDYYIYIMASQRNGTLYIGVTNDLIRRVYEHRKGILPGFTKHYGVSMLVHFEQCNEVTTAIQREKQLKGWNRKWKLALIERDNPEWKDLWYEIADDSVDLGDDQPRR
jgi:putative endonuclease